MIKLKDILVEIEPTMAKPTGDDSKFKRTASGMRAPSVTKKSLIMRFFEVYPEWDGASNMVPSNQVYKYKRNKNNTFTYEITGVGKKDYTKNDVLEIWEELYGGDEPKDTDTWAKDYKDAIIYYFDKWPKRSQTIEITDKQESINHFVDIPSSQESKLKQKYKNGKRIFTNEEFHIFEWQDGSTTKALAHSSDDTWFLMTKLDVDKYEEDDNRQTKPKYKIDDVLYDQPF